MKKWARILALCRMGILPIPEGSAYLQGLLLLLFPACRIRWWRCCGAASRQGHGGHAKVTPGPKPARPSPLPVYAGCLRCIAIMMLTCNIEVGLLRQCRYEKITCDSESKEDAL